jgi:alpha-tubulin suppressor-like RCC1 family protein
VAHPRIRRPVRLPIGLRFGAPVLLAGMLSVIASCSDGSPTQPADLTSIEAQIRALFPSGASLQGAALTQIADIRQQIALSATAQARSKTFTLVDFTMTSFRDGKLVGGTSATAGNAASRLVNALYQLVGMDAPNLPDSALSNDGAAKVIGPEGALVVTPSGAAGVQIPAGALDQQVLVTVTRLTTPPTPGTGPLPTSLKQYPPYYDFSTFPAVAQFGDSARVGVCQVTDASSAFYPPEPHDRLRLAHTVGNSIEILDRVGVNDFLRCTNVSASWSTPSTDRNGLRGVLLAIRDNAIELLRPAKLYAAHGGLGGKVKSFSPFGAVAATFNLTSLAAGGSHTCGLTSGGAAYCWGYNIDGEVGDGTTTNPQLTPTPVAGGLTFTSLALGWSHTCGLTSGGAAYCWGYNIDGEVGDGTTTNPQLTPTPVAGGLTFTSLAVGGAHTCALTSGGAAYCWGWNANGQIGDGTATSRLTPTPVAGGLTFTSLALGGAHTCALTSGGAAYCWGANDFGQLGDGNATSRLTPTPVAGGLTFTSLALGGGHTCGLTSGGAAYCWGNNQLGELGDGTLGTSRLTPTPVAGGLPFTSLALGEFHTCGLTSGGTAYCWGDNTSGQVGDGTTTYRLTPTPVAGGLTFTSLAVRGLHTCGLTRGGAAYCWGDNRYGAIGDGTTTNRLTPTPVTRP